MKYMLDQLLIKPIRDEILNRVGTYYFGSDEVNIEESVINSAKQNFAIYDGVTNGALFTRLKNADSKNLVKGMLPHSNQFIDVTSEFNAVLFNAAQYVRDLYQTDLGFVLLNKDNIVYLGIYDGNNFDIETFKMSQSRNLLRSRSQNYAMIRLLNWFNK